jgi:hypothetical protein
MLGTTKPGSLAEAQDICLFGWPCQSEKITKAIAVTLSSLTVHFLVRPSDHLLHLLAADRNIPINIY